MNNEKVKIISVGEAELPGLLSLLNWRGTGIRPVSTDPFEALSEDDHSEIVKSFNLGYFWVYAALYDNEYAGYITISKVPKPDSRKGYLFIDELWVAQPFRGLGLAKLMIDEAFKLTETLGMWKTRLVVSSDNIPARSLYTKMGFVEDPAMFCQK